MYADYHLHCDFSDDSNEPMENQIEQAIKLGLDEMCFTDHVDYGIKKDWDDPEGVVYRDGIEHGVHVHLPLANVDYPKYFAKLKEMKEVYKDKITIKQGLEFGIQSITVDQYEKLYNKYTDELDFVLFSMHPYKQEMVWK